MRCDGDEIFSGDAWQVTVGLHRRVRRRQRVDADPTDGMLDVVVIEAGSRLRLVARAYGLRRGGIEEQRGVATCRGREVDGRDRGRATSSGGFNVDGEVVDEALGDVHGRSRRVRGRRRMSAPEPMIGLEPAPRWRLRAPAIERRRPLREGVRRYRLAGAVGAALVGWYATESLRHRREGAFGYDLETELDVASPDFLRAAEALTGAPITEGNEAELLINGDRIFPAMLETIRARRADAQRRRPTSTGRATSRPRSPRRSASGPRPASSAT